MKDIDTTQSIGREVRWCIAHKNRRGIWIKHYESFHLDAAKNELNECRNESPDKTFSLCVLIKELFLQPD